jgi:hypothetical protein
MLRFFKIYILLLLLASCQNHTNQSVGSNISTDESIKVMEVYKAQKNRKDKSIVLISGDEEYRSEEALPQLAKILSTHHGFDCMVLFSQDPEKLGYINPNYSSNIPGMETLAEADLIILFTRFRALPDDQMQHLDNYLLNGKPLLGIRTSTHAFNYKDSSNQYAHYSFNYKGPKSEWELGFGKLILGETWHTHHGHHKHQSTRGLLAPRAENHPLVNGIEDGSVWGPTDVYGVRTPIKGDAQHIILGQTIDRVNDYDEIDPFYGMRESDNNIASITKQGETRSYNPNKNLPPIVWTKSYQIPNGKKGQSITSTIGSSTDLIDEEVRRLMINACFYLLGMDVPEEANVDLVGKYTPSAYQFHEDSYWINKALQIGQ